MVQAKKKALKTKKLVDRLVEDEVDAFMDATKKRYEIALRALKSQDEETTDAILRVADRFSTTQPSYLHVYPHGKNKASVAVPIPKEVMEQNALYIATEIFKDLAFLDIRIANYVFPRGICAECGKRLTPKKAVPK